MGWQILPVRDTPDDPIRDDYLLWSSITEAPFFRGTRREAIRQWRFYEQGAPTSDALFDTLFELADQIGSSSRLGDHWGERIKCMGVPGGPGLLPRERLREFADLMFAGDADVDVAALLEPFETGDDLD